MVAHACNSTPWRQEDYHKFEASLDFIAVPDHRSLHKLFLNGEMGSEKGGGERGRDRKQGKKKEKRNRVPVQ